MLDFCFIFSPIDKFWPSPFWDIPTLLLLEWCRHTCSCKYIYTYIYIHTHTLKDTQNICYKSIQVLTHTETCTLLDTQTHMRACKHISADSYICSSLNTMHICMYQHLVALNMLIFHVNFHDWDPIDVTAMYLTIQTETNLIHSTMHDYKWPWFCMHTGKNRVWMCPGAHGRAYHPVHGAAHFGTFGSLAAS